jgi:hypothetical protein
MAAHCKERCNNLGQHSAILTIALSVASGHCKKRNSNIGQQSIILIIAISVIEKRFNFNFLSSGQHSAILIIAMSMRVVHLDKLIFCNLRQHSATLIIAASSKGLTKSRDRSIGQYTTISLKVALVIGESSVLHLNLGFHRNSSMAYNFISPAAIFLADKPIITRMCLQVEELYLTFNNPCHKVISSIQNSIILNFCRLKGVQK